MGAKRFALWNQDTSAERPDRPARECARSDIARMLPNKTPSPLRPEQVAPLRISLVEIDGIDDPVGPKTAKISAKLAPGGQYPHGLVVADRDRPDRALAVAAVFVAVAQRDFLSFMDLRACPRHVDAIRLLA